jgi:hypothetical protein
MLGNGTPTPNVLGRGFDLAETRDTLGLVFNARNYVQQVHRLQNHPHISTRSQQSQARTALLKGNKYSHDGPDARRIQLRDIGQIDQYLVGSTVNQRWSEFQLISAALLFPDASKKA